MAADRKRPHSRDGASAERSAHAGARDVQADAGRPSLTDAVRDAHDAQGDGVEPGAGQGAPGTPFGTPGQFTGSAPQADLAGSVGGMNVAPGNDPATAAGTPMQGNAEWGGLAPGTKVVPLDDLDLAIRQRDEFRADLQRLAAEFDNFRKRAAREREQAASAADARLLGELLAVLDDFERAMQLVQADGSETGGPVRDGIAMVHSRLLGVLAQHGLTEIEAVGPFDPHLHDAVMMQPGTGTPDGHVVQVVQKGYRLGDRVLRHSKVVVSGEPGG